MYIYIYIYFILKMYFSVLCETFPIHEYRYLQSKKHHHFDHHPPITFNSIFQFNNQSLVFRVYRSFFFFFSINARVLVAFFNPRIRFLSQ